ncbi:MAG: hypothetical protein IKY83_09095 [Proteobacteria bacterium]|nr:hypothetical protein [Pseudomonadota bacterium]
MNPIHSLDLQELHTSEQRLFATQTCAILRDTLGQESPVTKDFVEAADKYLVATAEASPVTLSLAEADEATDRAWSALYHQLQASLRDQRNDVRNAAESLQAVYEQFPNPTTLNYASEYNLLRALLTQLEALPEETLTRSRAADQISQLRTAYNAFTALNKAHAEIASTRVYGVRHETRTSLIDAWKTLRKRLPVLVDLNKDEAAEKAIQQINALVDNQKNALNARSKKD